jgi:hypothetical protein
MRERAAINETDIDQVAVPAVGNGPAGWAI